MQANSEEGAPITAINITPLVDVALVLVIIFMITLPFLMEKAMGVNHSKQKVVAVSSVLDPILVEVSPQGLRVEGRSIQPSELAGRLRKLLEERKVSSVAVSADPKVTHGQVIEVLDQVMESGSKELNLLEPKGGKT